MSILSSVYDTSVPSIYRGKVLDNEDPLNLGRCKITVPSVHGNITDPNLFPWARPIVTTPVSATRGSIDIPDIGDIVWVFFEGAQRDYPIYIGGTYSTNDIKVDKYKTLLHLEDGNMVVYDRKSKTYQLSVGDQKLVLDKSGVTIIGNLSVKGNVSVEGVVVDKVSVSSKGVSLNIPEVTTGEPTSTDGSTDIPPSTPSDTSDKSLEVTGGIGINRLTDSEAFCSSLITMITVTCRDENGITYSKNLSVNKYIAQSVKDIFSDIYNNTSFCIQKDYTGAYNYRKINGKDKLSYHSYGVAIDINWGLNPYSKNAGGSDDNLRMRSTSHPVVQIFQNHGWGWGGSYSDYMHFSYFNGY